jgi:hypothetical protein
LAGTQGRRENLYEMSNAHSIGTIALLILTGDAVLCPERKRTVVTADLRLSHGGHTINVQEPDVSTDWFHDFLDDVDSDALRATPLPEDQAGQLRG